MKQAELKILLPLVIKIAQEAGAFMRKERSAFSYESVEVKGLNDLVSYVDKSSEQLIVAGLSEILPNSGFIVEENTKSDIKEYNWIVDPLDGTTNFIHGIPCYAVSIALEHNNTIMLGVVYEVSADECFSAILNGGAFLNGETIAVSKRKNLSESLIATGFPIYDFSRLENYLTAFTYFMRHTHGLRRIGAAAVDLCYLACGRVDGFFEYNLHPWDVAAGGLIVKEAGGKIADFSGNENWIFGREACAHNGLLESEFNAVIYNAFSTIEPLNDE